MKKYALIEVIEREISNPIFFDTHEEATRKMAELFSTAMGLESDPADFPAIIEEIASDYDDDTKFDPEEGVAYGERYGNNIDYEIFEAEV